MPEDTSGQASNNISTIGKPLPTYLSYNNPNVTAAPPIADASFWANYADKEVNRMFEIVFTGFKIKVGTVNAENARKFIKIVETELAGKLNATIEEGRKHIESATHDELLLYSLSEQILDLISPCSKCGEYTGVYKFLLLNGDASMVHLLAHHYRDHILPSTEKDADDDILELLEKFSTLTISSPICDRGDGGWHQQPRGDIRIMEL